MREYKVYIDIRAFCDKLLEFSKGLGFFMLLQSNSHAKAAPSAYNKGLTLDSFDWMAALYPQRLLSLNSPSAAFDLLGAFHQNSWLVGYLSYGLKAETEQVRDALSNSQNFPALEFAQPGLLITANNGELTLQYSIDFDPEAFIKQIEALTLTVSTEFPAPQVKAQISKEKYIEQVNSLKQHIQLGDIYEANYCMEFKAEAAQIEPALVFRKLMEASPVPFSAYVKTGDRYLLCASPERFMKKVGNTVYSQPIKGTAPRGANNAEDKANIEQLLASEKERSENVMIVDLVRNDLGRTAAVGTVKVDELYGVYHFPRVHHLISTISANIAAHTPFAEVIKKAFPMGSMTGAPKIRAMQLIDVHEAAQRGLFSGSVGYITPEGDFDFNVVIRSIFYDADSKVLSYWAGSAITAQADAAAEYDECMLKLAAIKSVLE